FGRRSRNASARAMTDFAVIVVLRFIVGISSDERSPHERLIGINSRVTEGARDHVLMFIVRKLNQELARGSRITKCETCVVPRRNSRVATATNHRSGAFEELLTMATHTGSMTGKICNVGKLSYFFPVSGWSFVAGVAGALMLLSR